MMNLKGAKTRFIVGESRKLTRTKFCDWHDYQKGDENPPHDVIKYGHYNRHTRKYIQVDAITIISFLINVIKWIPNTQENSINICFDKKMANKSREVFLLTTKFYKITNNTALLAPEKWNPEGKESIHPEGKAIKNQENTKTKQIAK